MKLYNCRMCGAKVQIMRSKYAGFNAISMVCRRGHQYLFPNTYDLPAPLALRNAIRQYNEPGVVRHA